MNQVILKGNLTRDPEVKPVGNSTVANFSLAVDNSYKKGNDWVKNTIYVDCEAWDTGATRIGEVASKGTTMLVSGSLKQESWEKDGQKHSKLKVRVSSFELIQKREAAAASASKPAEGGAEGGSGTGDAPPSDIPF